MSISIVNGVIFTLGLLICSSCSVFMSDTGYTITAKVSKDSRPAESEQWIEGKADGTYVMELRFMNNKTGEENVIYSKPIMLKTEQVK